MVFIMRGVDAPETSSPQNLKRKKKTKNKKEMLNSPRLGRTKRKSLFMYLLVRGVMSNHQAIEGLL